MKKSSLQSYHQGLTPFLYFVAAYVSWIWRFICQEVCVCVCVCVCAHVHYYPHCAKPHSWSKGCHGNHVCPCLVYWFLMIQRKIILDRTTALSHRWEEIFANRGFLYNAFSAMTLLGKYFTGYGISICVSVRPQDSSEADVSTLLFNCDDKEQYT